MRSILHIKLKPHQQFERDYPAPDGVEYDAYSDSYIWSHILSDAPHNELWLAWQKGRDSEAMRQVRRLKISWLLLAAGSLLWIVSLVT